MGNISGLFLQPQRRSGPEREEASLMTACYRTGYQTATTSRIWVGARQMTRYFPAEWVLRCTQTFPIDASPALNIQNSQVIHCSRRVSKLVFNGTFSTNRLYRAIGKRVPTLLGVKSVGVRKSTPVSYLKKRKNPNLARTNRTRTHVLPRTEPVSKKCARTQTEPNPEKSWREPELNSFSEFTHFTVYEAFYFT